MKTPEVLERYVEICIQGLEETPRIQSLLKNLGVRERFLYESFRIGYATGRLSDLVQGNEGLEEHCEKLGLLHLGKEVFAHYLTFPILNGDKEVVNLVGYNLHPRAKKKLISLNSEGIFNQSFLAGANEVVLAESPVEALLLIQNDVPNVSFVFGDDQKYVHFFREHGIRKVIFAFQGRARLYNELATAGVSVRRVALEVDKHSGNGAKAYLEKLLAGDNGQALSSDDIQEIEGGFLFRFPQLSYRVIGNFSDYGLSMKANIKAFTEEEVFVDSIDLYKNRDRQNLIYNLMDRFGIRDQVELEQELHQIIEVIERHREKKEEQKKRVKPELTDYQKDVGLRFLSNPKLIEEIDQDYTRLGYVRERKNKILLYLIMTSRLIDNPLHGILISRSGAGKSLLVEITENLCPPEDVESISDLSAQALYYYGQNDLKHKFIVIGEKEGSQGAEYPLRELITRRSITKAIPMKDPVSGEIKTVTIKVNGPISLAETTTSSNVNPENLNRCFVLSIDESEEQTRLIHQLQRRNYTLNGFLQRREEAKILEKHVYAQRLLKPILVFNPYAEALTFPSCRLPQLD